MLRTISLLAFALLAHVTLVAALTHACGPQCGSPQFSNYSNQHNKPQLQLGNRANIGNKNGLSLKSNPAQLPQAAIATQPAAKPQEQIEHPADLPTNEPPAAATVARS